MNRPELGPQRGSEGHKFVGEPSKLHLTPWFKDFAERSSASYSVVEYTRVALVQRIRRHPRLQEKIESLARRLGREVDLNKDQS